MPNSGLTKDRYLSIAEAGEILKLSEHPMRKLVKAGTFTVISRGPRQNFIPASEVDAFMEREKAAVREKERKTRERVKKWVNG